MGLIAGYKFNGNGAEALGRAEMDVAFANLTPAADGVQFTGAASENATIPAAGNGPLRRTQPFAVYARFHTAAEANYEQLFHSTNSANFSGWNLFTGSGGQVEFMYGDNTGTSTGNRRSTSITNSAWDLAPDSTYDMIMNVPEMNGTNGITQAWLDGILATGYANSGTGGAVVYPDADSSFSNYAAYGTTRNSSHRLIKFAVLDEPADTASVAAWIADPDAFIDAAGSNLTLSNLPSTIVRNTAFNVTVNEPLVAPTMGGNTTARIGGATGPVCTLNSVSGTGPAYTLNFTVPTNAAIQHDSATGHPLRITIGSETVQSGNIPFTPPAGQQFVNLTSLNTGTNSVITGYTSVTPAVGTQVVMPTTTSPQSLPLTVSAAGIASHSGTLTQNNTFSYHMILADGTIGAPRTFTFSYSSSSLSIVSINGGLPIQNGEGDVPVVLNDTTGVTGLALNGVAQAFEIVNGQLAYLTNSAWPACMYYEPIQLTVSTASTSASASTSMIPAGTNIAATADGTYNAANEGTIVGIPTPALGSQLELQTPSSNGVGFTAGGDWRLSFESGNPGYVWARTLDITDHTFSPWTQYPFASSGGGSDTTEPNIYLGGANPMTLVVGTPYTEPTGTTASDNVDGNVTSLIAITGTVNTAVPGTYTRTYTVADAAGNSRSVTRTIYVVAMATDTAVGALDADITVLPPEGLARHPAAFFLGNTHLVNVAGLNKARTGVLVAGATVTMLLQRNGVNVSGATWPIALTENPQVPASYYGAIPGTVSVAIGDELVLILMASAADGSLARWQHTLQVRERTI